MTDTELRRLAENATPGPWRFYDSAVVSDRGAVARSPSIAEQCAPGGCDDARFIAAASPDVIIALLDRCETLEKERDARPMITPEDAVYFVQACQQSGMDDEDDDSFRVTWEALRAHAAKGGE